MSLKAISMSFVHFEARAHIHGCSLAFTLKSMYFSLRAREYERLVYARSTICFFFKFCAFFSSSNYYTF